MLASLGSMKIILVAIAIGALLAVAAAMFTASLMAI